MTDAIRRFPFLLPVLAILAGCVSSPAGPGEDRIPVRVEAFSDTGAGPRVEHMQLGLAGAAILAEQIALTGGVRLVLPPDELEDTRTAWENRAEHPENPIPVETGKERAVADGEILIEGEDLVVRARWVEGDRTIPASARGTLGTKKRIHLLLRELALRLLAGRFTEDARIRVRLGITLREQGLVPQAIEEYKKAAALEPTLAAAHYNMGVAHDALGEVGLAVAAYRRAEEADPGHVEAKNNWALDDLKGREESESRAAFTARVAGSAERLRQIAAAAPRNREARFLLVEALELLGKISEAIEECERIKKIFPTESHAWEMEGMLLLGIGRFADATREFRRLSELEPALITNDYWLALALEGRGRPAEAAAAHVHVESLMLGS